MKNSLRDSLDAGKSTMGTHFAFCDPDIAELIGDTGLFDYAEFCAEYSVLDMKNLYHMARAAQCSNLPLMIKLDQESQGFWAQAALGAGFKSILFSDVRIPDDIDICHKIIRPETPQVGGEMGIKIRRPSLSSYAPKNYLTDLESTLLCIMLEKKSAIDNIDLILERAREKGVDMAQWGPADYSLSWGKPKLMFEDGIFPIEEKVIAKCIEYNIVPRAEISDVEQAKRYIDLGVRHFCIGWDRFILQAGLVKLGEGLKKLTEGI
ncbi:MAG: aldolase/citrate lyase family protein [Planktomarina sp.]|nr:aldolase/citrate lyase family protein [Planktomarina sp.]